MDIGFAIGSISGMALFSDIPSRGTLQVSFRDDKVWRRFPCPIARTSHLAARCMRFGSKSLPLGTLERLIDVAFSALGWSKSAVAICNCRPSGTAPRRTRDFRSCNADALKSYGDNLAAQYANCSVRWTQKAPCQMAIFAEPTTEIGHGLGHKTIPRWPIWSSPPSRRWLATRRRHRHRLGLDFNSGHINKVLDAPVTSRLLGFSVLLSSIGKRHS